MLICICKNVNEGKIEKLMPCSLEELRKKTGLGNGCGKCLAIANQKLTQIDCVQLDQ